MSPSKAPREKKADVVIVGAGVVGAIMAKELSQAGKRVLLLEAGRATSIRPEGYASYVETFHRALAKTPNSPYPQNPNAPHPDVQFQAPIVAGFPVTTDSHVYLGPLPFYSTFTRTLGGTTLHFLGTCIRMLPEDFELQTRYGHGVDWPISYDGLIPYYEKAELEMGVSADAREQEKEGARFSRDYQFPMQQLPPSYLDRFLRDRLKGASFPMGGEKRAVRVDGTPAGRNGMPNPKYVDPRTGQPYRPVGSPYDTRLGQRCEGNSSCVPICPVMAKYNALRSLYTINAKGKDRLELITQAVASKIELSEDRKHVTGIRYKLYGDEGSGRYEEFIARGKVYVVAAHAIETAKLLLASGAANSSDQVGRNLMDHPYLLTWGLAPVKTRLGVFRGPQITSEIPMRHGAFRSRHAAFRADIRNCGWDFATGAPYANVKDLVHGHCVERTKADPKKGSPQCEDPSTKWVEPLSGRKLKEQLGKDVQRQISFGFQIEQLPDPNNRVQIRDEFKDPLGNHRAVLSYNIDEYTRLGMKVARELSNHVIEGKGGSKVKGKDCTTYRRGTANSIDVQGEPFEVHGSGHVMGTHRMGKSKESSVVGPDQRSWDHHNLFLVGSGNMPTVGTSNPTLTIAALAFKAVEKIKRELR